jgi:hypothetical protein
LGSHCFGNRVAVGERSTAHDLRAHVVKGIGIVQLGVIALITDGPGAIEPG